MRVPCARLAALLALAASLAGCPDDDVVPTTALPTGLDLAGLNPEHRTLLRATLEISGGALAETEVVLGDDLNTLSGTFDVQNVTAPAERTLSLRVYGRFAASADEVLLGRLAKPITLEPEKDVPISFDGDVFDSCGGEAGACAVLFDANRNGASNIEDLLERTRSGGRGIDPAPQAPYLVTSSEQLQFPSGVRLGSFARQLVVLENFGENPVTISEAAVVGGQGFSISILDPTGQSVAPPGRALDGDTFRAIAPGQEAFVAVSFTPVNSFVTTGALFVRVKDQVTLVEQTARVKLIANPEGELRPADPIYVEPDLESVSVDGGSLPVVAFPNAQLQSGDALIAEDALGAGLRQSGASLAIVDGEKTVAFPADAAFAVDVASGQRFSTAIDGLTSDIDIAVVGVDAAGAITGLACETCRSANAGTSPEAVEFKNDGEARRVVVILGRIEPESDEEETEGALTVAETVSFRCSTTVSAGPEFADVDPVLPTTGPLEGGIPVVLKGSGFDPRAKVRVGDAEALDVSITRDDDGVDTVAFTLPAAVGTENPASIIVENPADGGDGQAATLLEAFTYQPPAPVIDEIRPDAASTLGGTTPVTIAGRFFSARFGPPQVAFGTVTVDATFVSASELTVIPPPHVSASTAATVSVKVRNRLAADDAGAAVLGSASNGVAFRYLVPDGAAPTLASIAPATGSVDGGTRVTLTGADFRAGLEVFFAGRPAACDTPTSATEVSCLTPAVDAPGLVSVTVVNPDGQSAKLDTGFAYVIPSPSITSVFPARGITDGGTFLVVEGGGFRPGARVTFTQGDTVRAATAATRVSGTTMLVTTPAGTAGPATLTITNLDNQLVTSTFTYFAPDQATPPPAITALSPSVGDAAGGFPVTISGSGFLDPSVVFGATPVTVTSFIDRTPPELDEVTVIAPPSPTGVAAAVNVQVINSDGQAAQNGFNYTFAAAAPPRIDRIDPSSFVQGQQTAFTVFGARFDAGARVLVGGLQAAITSVSATQIRATIGGQLPLGTVMLVVENPNGGAVNAPVSVVAAAGGGTPVVTHVSPRDLHANVAGDVVTIFGDNLDVGTLDPLVAALTVGQVASPARVLSRGKNVLVLELPALLSEGASQDHTLSLRFSAATTTTINVPVKAHRPRIFLDEGGGEGTGPTEFFFLGDFLHPSALVAVEFVNASTVIPCEITTANEQSISCIVDTAAVAAGSALTARFTWQGVFNNSAQPPTVVDGIEIGAERGLSGDALQAEEVVVPAHTDFGLLPFSVTIPVPGLDPSQLAGQLLLDVFSEGVVGEVTAEAGAITVTLTGGRIDFGAVGYSVRPRGGDGVVSGNLLAQPRVVGDFSSQFGFWPNGFTFQHGFVLPGDENRVVVVRRGAAPQPVAATIANGVLRVLSTEGIAPGEIAFTFDDQVGLPEEFGVTVPAFLEGVSSEVIEGVPNGIRFGARVADELEPSGTDRYFFHVEDAGSLSLGIECGPDLTATLTTAIGGTVVADLCVQSTFQVSPGEHVVTLTNVGGTPVGYAFGLGFPEPPPECGNGIVELGEACDEFGANGVAVSAFQSQQVLCNADCTEPPEPFSLNGVNPGRTLTPGDEDVYVFDVATRSDLNVFSTERNGTEADSFCFGSLTLSIEDAQGRTLVTTTEGDGGCAFAFVSVDPGTYTIRLRQTFSEGVLRTQVGAFTTTPTTCGDLTLDNNPALGGSETCDDGNGISGDGCDSSCRVEAGFICNGTGPGSCVSGGAICSDGVVEGDEECDEGGALEAGCDETCSELDEALDGETGPFIGSVPTGPRARTLAANDVDRVNFDLLTPGDIRLVLSNREGQGCGTSLANATLFGPGGQNLIDLAPDGCIDFVVPSLPSGSYVFEIQGTSTPLKYEVRVEPGSGGGGICGDGAIDPGEQCDDENDIGGDGCSALCAVEAGFTCIGVPSVCSPVSGCGDQIVQPGEACDGGPLCAFDCLSESAEPDSLGAPFFIASPVSIDRGLAVEDSDFFGLTVEVDSELSVNVSTRVVECGTVPLVVRLFDGQQNLIETLPLDGNSCVTGLSPVLAGSYVIEVSTTNGAPVGYTLTLDAFPLGPPPSGCQNFDLQSLPDGFVGGGGATFDVDGFLPGARSNAISSMPLQFPVHAEVDIVFLDEDDIAFFGTRYSGAATVGGDEVDNLVYARFHNAGASEQLDLMVRQGGTPQGQVPTDPAPFASVGGTVANRLYRAFFDDDGTNASVGIEDPVNQVSSLLLQVSDGRTFSDRFVLQAANTRYSNLLLCSPTFPAP